MKPCVTAFKISKRSFSETFWSCADLRSSILAAIDHKTRSRAPYGNVRYFIGAYGWQLFIIVGSSWYSKYPLHMSFGDAYGAFGAINRRVLGHNCFFTLIIFFRQIPEFGVPDPQCRPHAIVILFQHRRLSCNCQNDLSRSSRQRFLHNISDYNMRFVARWEP